MKHSPGIFLRLNGILGYALRWFGCQIGKNFNKAHTETSLVHNYNKYVNELDKDGELTLADVEYDDESYEKLLESEEEKKTLKRNRKRKKEKAVIFLQTEFAMGIDPHVEETYDFYDETRNNDSDIEAISKSTKLPLSEIQVIKDHIFLKFHVVNIGYKRFDPDYEMALFWKRLINGDVKEEDVTFLKLMLEEYNNVYINGMTIYQAHGVLRQKFDIKHLND
ncbi:MAG: hypothetical protein LBT59_19675 [Clostridiales bacterium]|nr:hypothetical protein [Clostridiales bacterium]